MLFVGYYGMGNFGDDLFGHATVHGAERWWGREAKVLAPPLRGADASAFALRNPVLARGLASKGRLGQACRLVSKTAIPLGHGQIIYGGGSTFSRTKRWDVRRVYAAAARAGLLDLGAVGVSVGPFRSQREEEQIVERLMPLRYLALRDDASSDYVESLGLDVTVARAADLAGTLPETLFPHATPQDDVLGVSVCPSLFRSPDADVDAVLADLADVLERRALRQGIGVKLFSLQSHPTAGDAPLVERLRAALPEQGVSVELYDGDAARMWKAIGACRYVVSARLHGAITAYLQGVPFVMLGYHPKCTAFASDVGLPVARYVEADGRALTGLDEAVDDLVSTATPPSCTPDEYRQKAALNFIQAPWA